MSSARMFVRVGPRLFLVMFFLLQSVGLRATDEAEKNEPAPSVDRIVAVELDGKTHAGTLLTLDAESVTIAGDDARPIRLENRHLLTVRFPARRTEDRWPSSMIFLENGDRLAANIETVDGEKLIAKSPGFPSVIIPFETVRGAFLNVPEIPSVQQQLMRKLLDRREASDLLVLANDDLLAGELQTIDPDSITFKTGAGEGRVERSRVRWFAGNQELISFPKRSGPVAIVSLSDRSRISALSWSLIDGKTLRVDAAYGGVLEVPFSSIVGILFLSEQVRALSDLEPAAYEFTPFLAGEWSWKKDRAVDGGALMLRGTEYAKGIGLHSRSCVRYDLAGEYRQFRAIVGIDDSTGGGGSAKFAVEVDGRRIFESPELTGNDAGLPVGPIDLTGARELTLVVEFGEQGDVLDRADWCEALLIK